MIELKTERASHRYGQLGSYFALGHHHHPVAALDLTYVTPSMPAVVEEPPGAWGRFSHVTWAPVAEIAAQTWSDSTDPAERVVLAAVLETLAAIDTTTPLEWRARWAAEGEAEAPVVAAQVAAPGAAEPTALLERALAMAEAVAADGRQRALDVSASSLEDLQQLRLVVRDALQAAPARAQLRHVQPWLWRLASGGRALTKFGEQAGYELRFSRYEQPIS